MSDETVDKKEFNLMKLEGGIAVGVIEDLRQIIATMASGSVLTITPESTITRDGRTVEYEEIRGLLTNPLQFIDIHEPGGVLRILSRGVVTIVELVNPIPGIEDTETT